MAEFKLGRIRFVWKGAWTPGVAYLNDDVVSNGGKSYICVLNHTASGLFDTDLDTLPTKWNIVSDGTKWSGDWSPSTYYNPGAVVKYGALIYICKTGHTSATYISPTYLGLEQDLGKWELFATSFNWSGNWNTATRYRKNDFVVYGGTTYVCNFGHVSAATTATLTATGFTVAAGTATLSYATQTVAPFAIGATVTLAGFNPTTTTTPTNTINTTFTVVTCTTTQLTFALTGTYTVSVLGTVAGTSQLGLENNANYWDYFNQGVTYLGNWSGSAVRYRQNDVVKYGGDLWICTTYHTSSGTTINTAKFAVFVNGFQFENSWDNSTQYQIGDNVTYGGYSYIAKTNNINKQPTANLSDWAVFTTGFSFVGEWDIATNYKIGEVVRNGAYTYLALVNSVGQLPQSETAYWTRLNNGFRWTNAPQTYLAQATTIVTGTGSGAKFDVIRSGTVYTVSLAAGFAGNNYGAGDKIKILGNLVGGITPANDITITVNSLTGSAINTFTWSGGSVTWTSLTDYLVGDTVTFGANTYVCINPHTASSGNRPNADTTGTYWNLMTAGSEYNILTDTGDLVYYGANGPTRLPVGTNGQVLRSQNGQPVWANYGLINNLVYVGPLGSDLPYPTAGATIDQPWKTVRYAAKQVEDGYLNPNSKTLLAMNKQFIMKEITNWITYTYTVTVTTSTASTDTFTCTSTANLSANMPISFTGTIGGVTAGQKYYIKTITSGTEFTISDSLGGLLKQINDGTGTMSLSLYYDSSYCERDVGLIVEAVKHDISRGGTSKTVYAAKQYYTSAGNAYINSNFGQQTVQTIAAYTYLKTLLQNVASNQGFTSYQVINNVADPVFQQVDSTLSLVTETGVSAKIDQLITIITTGILAGTTTAIPAAVYPNTTISVKTGTFTEVLPIVIEEFTAVVGDELRSTVIQPAPANALLVNDKPKSVAALTRINSVISNLIQNVAVTPTAGNNELQKYVGGFAGSGTVTTAVGAKTTIMTDILTNGLSSVPAFSLTDPTAYDAGYLNARRLIVSNKAFLQAEITAWINVQIAGNIAPFVGFTYGSPEQTNCERDVGYIVDALRYDLTYGGNLETIVAARAYYSLGAYVGDAASKLRALAVQARIKDIIDNIAVGDNAGWSKSAGNALNQDDSLPHGSQPAGAFAQARIQEIYDTINTTVIPTVIEPSTTWVTSSLVSAKNAIQSKKAAISKGVIDYITVKYPSLTFDLALCSRDVGYIVDAISYDIMLTSNFRSVKSAMAYYRGTSSTQYVIANQLTPTLDTITYIDRAIKQITNGYTGSVGSTTAVASIESNTAIMYDIVASGLSAVPTFVIPTPTAGTGNAYDVNYLNARTQIVQNYAFIKAEISAYLNTYQNSVWTGLGATGQAACQRDIGYILDAIRYGITYGGNLQVLIAGSSYYSNYSLTISSTEVTAIQDAYSRLKIIIGQIAQRQTVSVTAGNAVSQVVTGTGDTLGTAALFAQNRVQDIKDWITNGYAPATITPSITWASSELQASFAALQAKKTEICSDAVVWVKKYFQDINFNTITCSRDVGYIVDALSYDMVFGSNFSSITVGRSYNRTLTSTAVVLGAQKTAELALINFIKYKAKTIAAAGAVAQISSIISDINGYINGGAIPRVQWPNPATVDSSYAAGVVLLVDNTDFIAAEVTAYIEAQITASTAGFVGLEFSRVACTRDVKLILEALHYDLIYGYGMGGVSKLSTLIAGRAYYSALTSVLQIDTNDKTATVAAYNRLKSVAQSIIQNNTVTPSAGNTVAQVMAGVGQPVGSAGSATSLGTLVDTITSIITNGLTTGVPRITVTTIAGGTTFTTGSAHGLSVGDEVIPQTTPTVGLGGYGLVAGTKYYVQSTPLTTTFTLSVYQNGGAITSFTNGTSLTLAVEVTNKPTTSWVSANLITQFNALQANKATIQTQIINYITKYYPTVTYNQTTCQRDIGIIIDFVGYDMMFDSNYLSITSAKSYYRAQASLVIGTQKDATVGAFRYLKTLMSTIVTTDSTAYKRVRKLLDIIINTMLKGTGSTPEVNGTVTYKNDTGLFKAGEILRINKNFLAEEAAAYITLSYGGTVLTTTASTDRFTTSSAHNLTVGDPVVFSGTIITGSGVSASTAYYVATVPTTTTFTITAVQNSIIPVNITSDGSGSMTVRYAFNSDLCKRDTKEYIEAMIYDLGYTGNYKSLRAAEVYLNAVTGSQLSNMFYVSNGTGLRNCTLNGLNGSLTEENDYGTKRPTAGAFVALNPGFGPNDSHVWVNNRSHYSQNVSMFGTGCSGAKIDAAVHAGGNKSMVKNDFTTIISDGFGVWCTGQGSLTELVSVFNYYGYAGYMAELGGRIRATNGNSSYGSYGVIAEGTDTYEQPIYAVINNHAAEAYITNVMTDSANNILRVEFNNAGTNYTNADIAISGDGYNATTIAEEFRDSAVFETRIINLNDGNGVGGTNYGGAQNAAQSGTTYNITIANSDVALSTAYPGMRIQLTAGTGVGQYANILTFNQGTKVAQLYKDSFDALTITATATTNNLCTVASTASLFPGMQVYLVAGAASYNGLAANTLYYIRTANFSSTQFSLSQVSASGTVETITTTGSVSITLYAAGWDHAVPGTNIANTLDLTTSYVIEPRITYTDPGYLATSRTAQSNAWSVSTYANNRFVALPSSGTATSYSTDGKTWAAGGTVPSANWTNVIYGGGQGATATATVGGLGGQGAVLQAIMGKGQFVGDPTADQVIGVKIIDGGRNYTTAPTIVFTPTTGGVGAKALCTVLNGAIDAVYIDPVNIDGTSYGSGYVAAPTVSAATDRITKITVSTYGRGYTSGLTNVVITGGGYSSLATATASINATSGVNSVTITDAGAGYTSTPTVAIVDSNARYVAIANGSTTSAFLLSDASATANWTTGGSTGQTTMNALAYGGGVWVAIGGNGASTASSTTNAVSAWTTRSLPTLGSGSWNAVTYGNGRFVAISTGSTLITAYSTNGTSWTAGGNLPAGFTTGTSIAYGNGRFVAIASGARQVTYSIDNGVTWKTYGNGLPSSQSWTRIRYGHGLFIAIAQGAAVCAVSPDGIKWTEKSLPATTNWSALAFGNPNNNPIWTVLSATSGTTAASIRTGAKALGRMKQSSGVISEIRMIEPGSGYPKGTVTATTITTNVISTSDTTNLIDSQPIVFSGCDAGGLTTEKLYYVIGSTIVSNTSFKVSLVAGSATAVVLATATLSGTYRAGPIVTQTDPNKVKTAAVNPRTNDGVLGNPSYSNRGSTYTSATADTIGDGWADLYQPSTFVSVRNLHAVPQAGSNVAFSSISSTWYKLVAVTQILGNPGEYTATFQISPGLSVLNAPIDADPITNTIKYSQVRLTGHDFLYIGTGNQASTNYPYVDPTTSDITKQTRATAGGRVFFTSTDQDGNFNVGGLFGVQQSTGTATLNADAFNLSGLQSLQLGALNIGVGSAIITQFSTDPYFTADSDSIVPTQRAIKAYITAQIGGGQSSLNVNTLTAGIVYIANDSISTTSGAQLNIKAKMNFTGGIDGAPVALGFFLQR
jgi:hypothetical protein